MASSAAVKVFEVIFISRLAIRFRQCLHESWGFTEGPFASAASSLRGGWRLVVVTVMGCGPGPLLAAGGHRIGPRDREPIRGGSGRLGHTEIGATLAWDLAEDFELPAVDHVFTAVELLDEDANVLGGHRPVVEDFSADRLQTVARRVRINPAPSAAAASANSAPTMNAA